MTTAQALLKHLQDRDIHLTVVGDKLGVDAPDEAVTEELCTLLIEQKAELIALLSGKAVLAPTDAPACTDAPPPTDAIPKGHTVNRVPTSRATVCPLGMNCEEDAINRLRMHTDDKSPDTGRHMPDLSGGEVGTRFTASMGDGRASVGWDG